MPKTKRPKPWELPNAAELAEAWEEGFGSGFAAGQGETPVDTNLFVNPDPKCPVDRCTKSSAEGGKLCASHRKTLDDLNRLDRDIPEFVVVEGVA